MKKAVLMVMLLALAGCGTVVLKEGGRECSTMTIGIFGYSLGALGGGNGCPGR